MYPQHYLTSDPLWKLLPQGYLSKAQIIGEGIETKEPIRFFHIEIWVTEIETEDHKDLASEAAS